MYEPSSVITFSVFRDGVDPGMTLGSSHQDGLLTSRTMERLCENISLFAEAFAVDPLRKPWPPLVRGSA